MSAIYWWQKPSKCIITHIMSSTIPSSSDHFPSRQLIISGACLGVYTNTWIIRSRCQSRHWPSFLPSLPPVWVRWTNPCDGLRVVTLGDARLWEGGLVPGLPGTWRAAETCPWHHHRGHRGTGPVKTRDRGHHLCARSLQKTRAQNTLCVWV